MGCGSSSTKKGGEQNNVRSQTAVPPPPQHPSDPVYIPAIPDPIAPKPIPPAPKPAPYRPPPPAPVKPAPVERAVRDFDPQQQAPAPVAPQQKSRPKERSSAQTSRPQERREERRAEKREERRSENREERDSSSQAKQPRSPKEKTSKKKSREGRSPRDGRDQGSTPSFSYTAAQSTGVPVSKHRERKTAPSAAAAAPYHHPPAISTLVKPSPPPAAEPTKPPPPKEEPKQKRESSPTKPKAVVVVDTPKKKQYEKRREKSHADYDKVLSNKGMKMSDIPQPDSKSGKPFKELYTLKGVLGTGAFSTVREGSHMSNPDLTYAVKCVSRPKLSEEDEAALLDEVSILKEMNHVHIIRLYDFFVDPSTYYLVMERMSGGELFDRIVAKAYYNEKEARDTCKILLEAVGYCHDNQVAHRDLKPENLLLRSEDDDTSVKIADFGFAKKVKEPRSLTTQCGTPGYVAPEILEGVPYDTKSDMWSVGVILYILLGGYPPFIENNQRDLFRKIRKGDYEFHDEYWSAVSSGAKELISSLLTVDPDVRLDAQQALDNAWIRQDDELLEKKDLGVNLQEFKKFNAKRKFRAAVSSVLAVNKLQSLGKDFLGSLQDSA